MSCRILLTLFGLLPAAFGLFAQKPAPGRNSVTLRGQPQDVYFYPAGGGSGRAAGVPGNQPFTARAFGRMLAALRFQLT